MISGIILDESHQSLASQAASDETRFSAFFENAIEAIWCIDFDPPIRLDAPQSKQIQAILENGRYSEANGAVADVCRLASAEDIIGKSITDFMDPADPKNLSTLEQLVMGRYYVKNLLTYEIDTEGVTRCIVNNITPGIQDNAVQYVWGASLDITELLELRENLERSLIELDAQKKALEEKNTTLKELVTYIELDKKEFKERIVANIDNVILPALDKLNLQITDKDYIRQVRLSLEDLVSSFGQKIANQRVNLTPREIEVCNLVKNGLSNKDIARTLKIAVHTVEKHRRNARKKLGLTSKSINLNTHLNSF
jgi:DNA-binding CsgD family transcriptional regulator